MQAAMRLLKIWGGAPSTYLNSGPGGITPLHLSARSANMEATRYVCRLMKLTCATRDCVHEQYDFYIGVYLCIPRCTK